MDEATLCDRIALMIEGKILSMDTPANVIKAYPEKLYAIKSSNMHGLLKDVRANDDILTCYAAGEYIHLSLKHEGKESEAQLLKFLQDRGDTDLVFKETTPTVEDCFIRLLGNKDGNKEGNRN